MAVTIELCFQSLPGLIPRRLRRKVKSGFQDTSPLAARSFIGIPMSGNSEQVTTRRIGQSKPKRMAK
jgi:hypothetical protein